MHGAFTTDFESLTSCSDPRKRGYPWFTHVHIYGRVRDQWLITMNNQMCYYRRRTILEDGMTFHW